MLKLLAFTLLFLISSSDQMEKKFFSTYPSDTWVTRLRQYSLEDQYKIFRYGMDHVRPQAWSLADPIAEKGTAVIPFLTGKLNSDGDDLTVHDILVILWQMNYLKAFEVRQDTTLIQFLEDRVPKIKSPDLQYTSRVLLDDIKVARQSSSSK